MQLLKDFINGIWDENPIFRMVIGICSALAVTTAANNGIAMGLALTFADMFKHTNIFTKECYSC